MQCPVCENAMKEVVAAGVTVEVCADGCGGMWFDRFEIDKFDNSNEQEGLQILEMCESASNSAARGPEKISCPKCEGQIMRQFLYSAADSVEVDECPSCAGMWLDAGELASIRQKFASEEERTEAAKKVFAAQLVIIGEQKPEKSTVQRVAKMFRFICPSYWIPGDQDWGAY